MRGLDWRRYFTAEVLDEALQAKRRTPRLDDPFARFPTRCYWLKRMNRPIARTSPPLEPVTAGRSGGFAAVFATRAKRLDE